MTYLSGFCKKCVHLHVKPDTPLFFQVPHALLSGIAPNVGENPETVLADAGYANERDLQALESAGVDGYVALGRESKQQLAEVRSEPARERMRQKLSTEQGRNQYAERKWLSEAPNGWIKQVLGFRQFSVRGVEKVQGEWDLVCLALNAKRMLGLQMG